MPDPKKPAVDKPRPEDRYLDAAHRELKLDPGQEYTEAQYESACKKITTDALNLFGISDGRYLEIKDKAEKAKNTLVQNLKNVANRKEKERKKHKQAHDDRGKGTESLKQNEKEEGIDKVSRERTGQEKWAEHLNEIGQLVNSQAQEGRPFLLLLKVLFLYRTALPAYYKSPTPEYNESTKFENEEEKKNAKELIDEFNKQNGDDAAYLEDNEEGGVTLRFRDTEHDDENLPAKFQDFMKDKIEKNLALEPEQFAAMEKVVNEYNDHIGHIAVDFQRDDGPGPANFKLDFESPEVEANFKQWANDRDMEYEREHVARPE